jgi:uncharacterized protein (DUF2252 family)
MNKHLISKNKKLHKEGIEKGKSLKEKVTHKSHSGFNIDKNRLIACELLEEQNKNRIERLIPYRRGSMLESPFAFYRGAARIMAYDLKDTPVSGLNAQICGDAHLGNFGVYASPERQLVYDLNDFDETLTGPWEWDVKRLAASFAIAGIYSKLSLKDIQSICSMVTKSYRESMRKISKMRSMDIWYSLISFDKLARKIDKEKSKKKLKKFSKKAKTKDHLASLAKLTETKDDKLSIIHNPPFIVPAKFLSEKHDELEVFNFIDEQFKLYQNTVSDHTLTFLNGFNLIDAALKVVGVGSIGTACYIVLFEHKTKADPLFLQVKQAQASVLEEFLPGSRYDHSGRRVIEGQRLMQSVSDVFLGWSSGEISGNHYYWRQLKDWKASLKLENLTLTGLQKMAVIRGYVLAKSHARSADPTTISGYLDKNETFDEAIATFSIDYARQNASDFNTYKEYVHDNKLPVEYFSK